MKTKMYASVNFMKARKLLIILSSISTFCYGQETINDVIRKADSTGIVRKIDTSSSLKVETISITKPRRLLFITFNHEKLIIKDCVKTDNKVILKGKSKFVKSIDAARTVRFVRIKIRGNKIFKYKESSLRRKGIIIIYDLTGKKLKKERLDKEKVISEYIRE
jgi:hypothetical protein